MCRSTFCVSVNNSVKDQVIGIYTSFITLLSRVKYGISHYITGYHRQVITLSLHYNLEVTIGKSLQYNYTDVQRQI